MLDITEEDIVNFFQSMNIRIKAKIAKTHDDLETSLGYGYLNFQSEEEMNDALQTKNYMTIKGNKQYRLSAYQSKEVIRNAYTNVIVRGLPNDMTNKELYDLFSKVGNITSCVVSEVSRQRRIAHGYVSFETRGDADKAVNEMDNTKYKDNTILVSHVDPDHVASVSRAQIFLSNIPRDSDEDYVRNLCKGYGNIVKIDFPKKKDDSSSRPSFVFIKFEKEDEATEAVKNLNEKVINQGEEASSSSSSSSSSSEEKKLYCAICTPKWMRDKKKMEMREKYRFCNLYVNGFPPMMEDSDLRRMFEKFGQIRSCKIMRLQSTGESKGFGFCCFEIADSARKAYLELNGKKPIMWEKKTKKKEGDGNTTTSSSEEETVEEEHELEGSLFINYALPRNERQRRRDNTNNQARDGKGTNQNIQNRTNMNMMRGPVVGPNGQPMQMPMYPMQFNPFFQQQLMRMSNQMMNPTMQGINQQQQQQMMRMGMNNQQMMNQQMMQGRGQPFFQNPYQMLIYNQQMMALRQQQMQAQGMNMMNAQQMGGRGVPQMMPQVMGNAYPVRPVQNQVQMPQQGRVELVSKRVDRDRLNNMDPGKKKEYLGELLYPLVQQRDNQRAEKITGMLLDLPLEELVDLIENSEKSLSAKVAEAQNVLEQNSAQ